MMMGKRTPPVVILLGMALVLLLLTAAPKWIERRLALAIGQSTVGPPPGAQLGLGTTSMEPVIVTARHNVLSPKGYFPKDDPRAKDPKQQPWIRFSIPAAYFSAVFGTTGADGSAGFDLHMTYDTLRPLDRQKPLADRPGVIWLQFPGAAIRKEQFWNSVTGRIFPGDPATLPCRVVRDAEIGMTRYRAAVGSVDAKYSSLCMSQGPDAAEGFIKLNPDESVKFAVYCEYGLRDGWTCELNGALDIWLFTIFIPSRDPHTWNAAYDRVTQFLREHTVDRSPQRPEF
jgi:hypothetical protein